jgi:hypothetical protein
MGCLATQTNSSKSSGLSEVIERLEDGRLNTSQCYSAVEYAYYESTFRLMAEQTPSLIQFDGELHTEELIILPN